MPSGSGLTRTYRTCGVRYDDPDSHLYRKRDWYQLDCKACFNRRSAKRYAANREKRIAQQRERYRAVRAAERAKQAEYRDANRRKIQERQRAYYAANRERLRARQKAYQKENLVVVRASSARRRGRERNAPGSYTAEDVERQMAAQGGRCFWCPADVREEYHVDHYVPLARGGTNYPDNIVIACPACNCSRKDKLPEEFAEVRGA